jgi:hypothetical protein
MAWASFTTVPFTPELSEVRLDEEPEPVLPELLEVLEDELELEPDDCC